MSWKKAVKAGQNHQAKRQIEARGAKEFTVAKRDQCDFSDCTARARFSRGKLRVCAEHKEMLSE